MDPITMYNKTYWGYNKIQCSSTSIYKKEKLHKWWCPYLSILHFFDPKKSMHCMLIVFILGQFKVNIVNTGAN